MHLKDGITAEKIACQHLQANGLKLIKKNFRTKCGEIDLIMREQKTTVFVEVRYRRSNKYGSPFATIDQRKQRKLMNTAQLYLQHNRTLNKVPSRFDVVGIENSLQNPKITWIRGAFY